MNAVLVIVAGQAGSGRGRFGHIVAERTGARLLDMADLRAGVEEPLPDPEDYEALLAVAAKALEAHLNVVVVAPFHTVESRRQVMRVAADAESALLYIECRAHETMRRRRLRDALVTRVDEAIAADARHLRVGGEIPRACQMHIDTTVGIALWANLAACRVESYVEIGPGDGEEQVLRA